MPGPLALMFSWSSVAASCAASTNPFFRLDWREISARCVHVRPDRIEGVCGYGLAEDEPVGVGLGQTDDKPSPRVASIPAVVDGKRHVEEKTVLIELRWLANFKLDTVGFRIFTFVNRVESVDLERHANAVAGEILEFGSDDEFIVSGSPRCIRNKAPARFAGVDLDPPLDTVACGIDDGDQSV